MTNGRAEEIQDLLCEEVFGETSAKEDLAGVEDTGVHDTNVFKSSISPVSSPGEPEAPEALQASPFLSQEEEEDSKEEQVSGLVQTLLQRERARENLLDFARFVDPAYKAYAIHEKIAAKLEDVEKGTLRRLAIFVPPAIGKSHLASELFPAWFFGKNPDLEFIQTSYDFDLAASFGRNVRNTLKEPSFSLLFPETALSVDSTAMNEWNTAQGGEYKAEGVGGGLIGFHAHIAVIDDPFKNYASAASKKNRDDVWSWYAAVLLNRLRPYKNGPGAVILIMQRWHDDDLGGRVEKLARDGEEKWEIISIPSIAEEGDPLERPVGAPLLPEGPNQRTLDELNAIRARSPQLFMALHQQKPVADEGELFHPSWLKKYSPVELPGNLAIYLSTDYALSKGRGDYTVIITIGVDAEGHVWILDVFRKQFDILEGVEATIALMKKHTALKCFVEKTSLAKAYGPVLKKRQAEENAWTLIEEVSIIGHGAKNSPDRAGAAAAAMQLGYFHVPSAASWLGELEYELSRFPNGAHDDQVDALTLIGMRLAKIRGFSEKETLIEGPPVILPTSFTFNDARAATTRQRLGLPRRLGALVVPFPETTILDSP